MITRKTKIIAKIADNKSEVPFIKSLKNAGADVWWLNTAHQDVEETIGVVQRLREVSNDVPILLDTKGPEVRTKNLENPIEVKSGDFITFTGNLEAKGQNVVPVSYSNFENEVPVGEVILYDDASVSMEVVEKTDVGIKCLVKNSGVIKNKKSLNVPNVHISLPALTEKDTRFIHFCAKENIDYIIHSFVRNVNDLNEIKNITKDYKDYKGNIIAKIENREGFENVEEILDNCQGLMVARGDLGAEVPLPEMFYMQKKMVESCLRKGKICIVATQVLDSMIKNPRPTRAEVTDAGNAVLDGTSAISMSGETAYGDYPIEATEMMSNIMTFTEEKIDELVHFVEFPRVETEAVKKAREVLNIAEKEGIDTVVVDNDPEMVKALSAWHSKVLIGALFSDDVLLREHQIYFAVKGFDSLEKLKATLGASKVVFVSGKEAVVKSI
jgi:pyruvate kinase